MYKRQSKHSTLRELQEKVRAEKADIGFGFDGDGDRTGIVLSLIHISEPTRPY